MHLHLVVVLIHGFRVEREREREREREQSTSRVLIFVQQLEPGGMSAVAKLQLVCSYLIDLQ
jgi:hypothetical protein